MNYCVIHVDMVQMSLMCNSPVLPNAWMELNGVAMSGRYVRLSNLPNNVSAVEEAAE